MVSGGHDEVTGVLALLRAQVAVGGQAIVGGGGLPHGEDSLIFFG